MDSVVHFEIPADDVKRASAFYKKAFGWDIQQMGDMEYWGLTTTEVDAERIPKNPGAINGGMGARGGPLKVPVVTIAVEEIDKAIANIAKVRGQGGGQEGVNRGDGLHSLLQGQRREHHRPLAERSHLVGRLSSITKAGLLARVGTWQARTILFYANVAIFFPVTLSMTVICCGCFVNITFPRHSIRATPFLLSSFSVLPDATILLNAPVVLGIPSAMTNLATASFP